MTTTSAYQPPASLCSAANIIRNAPRYANLIERVRAVDPAAAEYMEGPGREQPSHAGWGAYEMADQGRLVWAFDWASTPQGYSYWKTLEAVVDGTSE